MRTVVPGVKLLQAMANAGLIKLHDDTGCEVGHWTGQTVTAFYVDGLTEGTPSTFEYKGREYRLKYFDGCFCPFVVDIKAAAEQGIDLDNNLIA